MQSVIQDLEKNLNMVQDISQIPKGYLSSMRGMLGNR